ncbi:MAG: ROK family transcriptional regulator [Clostridia bacterium]|nr:ROK family transcriptional regulator [Clostridia bacterium]
MKEYRIYTNEYVKKLNSVTIMQVINEFNPISKIEIARLTGLNPATVTNIVNKLIEDHFVKLVGEDRSSGGRKPTLLAIDDTYYFSIGVTLTKDELSFSAINLRGEIIAKMRIPLEDKSYLYDFIAIIDENVDRLKRLCLRSFEKLYAIGFTTDGIIDTHKGMLMDSPYFKWHHLNVKYLFENTFEEHIFFDTRARSMAIAEKIFGYGKDCSNLITVDISSNMSVGMFVNNKLVSGNNYGAGELSHVRVSNRNKCTCGKIGCLNTFVTDSSLEKKMIDRLEGGEISEIFFECLNEEITAKKIYEGANLGDRLCSQIVREAGRYVGRGLSYLVNINNPEKIFISGAYTATNVMNREINKGIADYSYNKNLKQVYIGESSFREDAELMGAATLGFKDIFLHD